MLRNSLIYLPHLACLTALAYLTAPLCSGADYLRDIKPLLTHKCYACHAALKQQAGLRLDTGASLIQGGESGAAITPGKPEASLLIDVLTGDAGFRMPPDSEGTPLTAEEIDLFREWIAAGASIPSEEAPQADPAAWWSYRPIARPPLPQVVHQEWCRTPVDYFVAAERDHQGLPHVAEASRSIWLRRVYLDLIGLPPTPAEQSRFLSDASPSAYESVVDELLSRPQYGERWGRHWMDIWRYSDWYGSRGGNEIRYSQRHIWRWRDWIIDSLNDDKSYAQMIREMLAADELCEDSVDVLPATGYLGRNWYKFDRDAWLFETVERTGEAFLGLTFRCCRCHDHKFDPVTQEEYYRFRAIFEPHDVRTDPISAFTETEKDATLGEVLRDGIALVYDKSPESPTFLFERGDSRRPDKTHPLQPGVPAALGGEFEVQPVSLPTLAWYPLLRPALRETLIRKAQADVESAESNVQQAVAVADGISRKIKQLSDTAIADSSPPTILLQDNFSSEKPTAWKKLSGSWNYVDGKLQQTDVTHFATLVSQVDVTGDFRVHVRYKTFSPGTYRSVGFSFDYLDQGNSQDVYTSTGDNRQSVQAFHRLDNQQIYPPQGIVDTSLSVGEEITLDVTIIASTLNIELNGQPKLDYVLPVKRRDGKFALWVHAGAAEFLELEITQLADSKETLERNLRDATRAATVAQVARDVAAAKLTSLEKRLAAEVAKYFGTDESQRSQLALAAAAAEASERVLLAELEVAKAADEPERLAQAQTQLTTARQATDQAVEAYSPLGEQFPATSSGRRAALAEWICSSNNPRTARVAANHLWGRHFGQPLVASTENFGLNGSQPTHPQLLDWLAAELIAHDWKMKPLHRQLVLSATYRMSTSPLQTPSANSEHEASVAPDAIPSNPEASDQLWNAAQADPQNRWLWRMNSRRMEAELVRDSVLYLASKLDMSLGGPEIPESQGEATLRRSLYFRNTPNEKMLMLEVFDVADPNACYRRVESIVPHQSLAMLNSGLTQDAARSLAEQISDETDFITAAFTIVLGRQPSPLEKERCQLFLQQHSQLLQSEAAGPAFPAGGSSKRAPASEAAARAKENLILVLFSHNDFVTIR